MQCHHGHLVLTNAMINRTKTIDEYKIIPDDAWSAAAGDLDLGKVGVYDLGGFIVEVVDSVADYKVCPTLAATP